MHTSLFNLLLKFHREKFTGAFRLWVAEKTQGFIYFQFGVPRSCTFQGLTGLEALEVLYQEERSGMEIELEELDELGIYTENIQEEKFSDMLLGLFERFRQRRAMGQYLIKTEREENLLQ